MRIIELDRDDGFCCPVCQQQLMGESNNFSICDHVLIIATDEGVEFANKKVNIDKFESEMEEKELNWE